MPSTLTKAARRLVDVREGEGAALFWSFTYFFLILTAYYILRPIRDEMGVVGGVENLAWLFTGTLGGMLVLHPLYGSLVAAQPRSRFVPLTHRFFILNLVLFFLAFRVFGQAHSVWVGRVFFIWVSVFNLFVVSVFWSFMADLFRPEQGKRLFGALAIGGTLGAILGSSITSFAIRFGATNLLLVSALCLEAAVRASTALGGQETNLARAADGDPVGGPSGSSAAIGGQRAGSQVIGGGALEGIQNVLRSPYLLGIAAVMLCFTISTTFLYFQQADLTARVFGENSQGRTRFFANIDLAVNVLTLFTQLFVTGRLLKRFGMVFGLAFLPIVSVIGFGALALAPVLTVLVLLQVIRRAGNYAIHRPAREVLYTVLPRTDKYKAKNFNDTFVYRVGDQTGAWTYTLVSWLGLSFTGLSLVMVPFSALWLGLAIWLGLKSRRLQERTHVDPHGVPLPTAGAGLSMVAAAAKK